MDKDKFFAIVFNSEEALRWILCYLVSGYSDKVPLNEMLEQVRSGLVNDMYDWQVVEAVTESVRSVFTA